MGTFDRSSDFLLFELEERMKDVEEKVFPHGKPKETSRAQQVLLLKYLGLLDLILKLPITKGKKAKLLSLVLNRHPDNIEDDLTKIHLDDSSLTIETNYEFLVQAFQETGLEKLAQEAQEKLSKIESEKNKSKK